MLGLAKQLFHRWVKKAISRWIEGADARYYQEPHPWSSATEEISQICSKSQRNEGFEPRIMHPKLEDVHQEDEPPSYLALNISSAYVQEDERTIENRDSALRKVMHRCTALPGQRPQF